MAAANAVPKLSRNAASTRGALHSCQISAGPSPAALANTPTSGISTIRPSHARVMPMLRPNPGSTRGRRRGVAADVCRTALTGLLARLDLVEHAAIGEVLGLRLLPGTEGLADGDQLHLREARDVGAVGMLGVARPVVVTGGDALPFRRIQVPQIGLGDFAGAVAVDI